MAPQVMPAPDMRARMMRARGKRGQDAEVRRRRGEGGWWRAVNVGDAGRYSTLFGARDEEEGDREWRGMREKEMESGEKEWLLRQPIVAK